MHRGNTMEIATKKTWKPTVAGILNIVAAACHLLGVVFIVIVIFAIYNEQLFNGFFMDLFPPDMHQFVQIAWGFSAFFCVVAIVLELLGSIYAFKRQRWILVLISSVVAFLAFFPIGIPAVILTVLTKGEFKS